MYLFNVLIYLLYLRLASVLIYYNLLYFSLKSVCFQRIFEFRIKRNFICTNSFVFLTIR